MYADNNVPGIGEVMLASFPESAQFDPKDWYNSIQIMWNLTLNRWISEKYDGVRASWNPETQLLHP